MKKVLLSLCLGLLAVPNAHAVPSCGSSLMPAFTANQATQLCKTFGSAVSQSLIPSADNTYDVGSTTFGWRTGYFDTSVITPLVNHATSLALGIGGTAEATLTNDTLTFSGAAASIVGGATSITLGSAGSTIIKADADANRLFTWDGAGDADLTMKFGDSGTTAAQVFAISSSTPDADDDSLLRLCGAGLCNSSSRGSTIQIGGNEASNPGIYAFTGSTAGADISFGVTDDFIVETVGGADSLVIDTATAAATFSGTVTSTATSSIGWTVIASGAGVDCNTACTSACVAGQNATYGLESCSTAVTGWCICAGAS